MTGARTIEYRALDSIQPHPRNPKDHDIGGICRSIVRFGFNDAVILDGRTGRLVSGHGRIEALRALRKDGQSPPHGVDGDWRIPVQLGWCSADDIEAEAFVIAANRLVEAGGYHEDVLAAVLHDLAAADAIEGIGYDRDDVDRIINQAHEAAIYAANPDDLPDVADESPVKFGDLYVLGQHRLLCGDSLRADHIDLVLGSDSPDVCWTDPPYGVNYESASGRVLNDDAPGLEALLNGVFAQVARVLKPGAFIYVAHPAGANRFIFYDAFRKYFTFRQGLLWLKDALVLGHSDHHYMHEPIIYGMKAADSGRRGRGGEGWFGDDSQTSVFAFPKPSRSADHPTMKPVELVEAMLKNSSAPGHVVIDPFSGSGTTIVACERMGRKCRAIELDPVFVFRTIARWEALTGQTAVKLDSLRTGG